jgi:hypothetical protein
MTSTPPVRIRHDLRLMVASVLDHGAAADHLCAIAGLAAMAQGRTDECRFACTNAEDSADRARNALAGAFLVANATHLVLVDGAIGFDPAALLDLIDRMQADQTLAIMIGPCTARQINWSLVAAARAGGKGADNPDDLARFGGHFVLELVDPSAGIRVDQPVELAGAQDGLMVIRRDVIETLCERHPDLRYRPEPQDAEAGALPESLHALFQSTIDPASGRYLPGVTLFCYRARAAGFRLWLAPWLRTTNTGTARFAGSLADLADLEPLSSH